MKKFFKTTLLYLGAQFYKNSESKVLYYHDVHSSSSHKYTDMSTSLTLFKKHFEILRLSGYDIRAKIENKEKEVEITFDDGFRGLYENFSYFVDNKIYIRLFVVTNFIGKARYINATELRDMVDTGFLQIGSHTKTHRNLDTLDSEEVFSEFYESKKLLQDLLGMNIDTVCFPRGCFNDLVLKKADEAGYRKFYSSLPGSFYKHFKSPSLIHRSLVQHASASDFKAILQGADQIFYHRYLQLHYRQGNQE